MNGVGCAERVESRVFCEESCVVYGGERVVSVGESCHVWSAVCVACVACGGSCVACGESCVL